MTCGRCLGARGFYLTCGGVRKRRQIRAPSRKGPMRLLPVESLTRRDCVLPIGGASTSIRAQRQRKTHASVPGGFAGAGTARIDAVVGALGVRAAGRFSTARSSTVPSPWKLPPNLVSGGSVEVSDPIPKKGLCSRCRATTGPEAIPRPRAAIRHTGGKVHPGDRAGNLTRGRSGHTPPSKIAPQDNIRFVTDKGNGRGDQVRSGRAASSKCSGPQTEEASDEGHQSSQTSEAPLRDPRTAGSGRSPAITTVGQASNTFISDGYINSRVAKGRQGRQTSG
jgi:hypothetical protein